MRQMAFHDAMQGCHIENAAAVEVHDNEKNGAGKIHRVGGDQEDHETDRNQNVVVVAVVDPNETSRRY